MSDNSQQRVSDPPVEPHLDGQKYYICNMVSPVDKNQKCDVYAFRMLAVCKDKDEVDRETKKFQNRDPRWTIRQGEFGRFVPWVFDPDADFDGGSQHRQMQTILDQQSQEQQTAEDHFYERIMAEKMAAHKARLARKLAEETGHDMADQENTRESAISARYNVLQLEHMCQERLKELQFWKKRYDADFSHEDKAHAEKHDYPPPADVAPMFVV